MIGPMPRAIATLVAAALAALCLAAPLAAAAEPPAEREAYVARAEPICKRNVEANKHIFKGVKKLVKRGRLKPASRHFKRAAAAFGKTTRQLARIARPPADEARLEKWFSLLGTEKKLVAKIGKALAAGKRHKAERLGPVLRRNSNKANNAVLLFGFTYCRIEPSRFG